MQGFQQHSHKDTDNATTYSTVNATIAELQYLKITFKINKLCVFSIFIIQKESVIQT